MGQALYRKYRSRSLAEVIGQEHITSTLSNAIKSGRISHAYLFTGPRGTGKTSVARILAHEINKIPYSDNTQLDIIEIDAASNRRIDDIRELREKVHMTPVNAPYKVYIIDEVHMLTGESFNALLKTLEEPPSHVVFILATTESHKLPATIISRTQRFSFRLVDQAKVIGHLKNIAQKEGVKIADDALKLVADYGGGSFRDSIGLLDQLTNMSDSEITAKDVQQTLGLAAESTMTEATQCLLNRDHMALGNLLENLENQGVSTSSFVNQLAKHLAGEAVKHPHLYPLIDQLLEVPRAYNPKLKILAVLLGFASQDKQSKPVKTVATTISAPVVLQKPVTKQAAIQEPKPVEKPEVKFTANPNTVPLNDISIEQWQKTTEAIKKINVPLHSVLKHAVPTFDATNQKLTLAFKWQLHRKKLDDVKQKAIIVHMISEMLNGSIEIITVLDKEAAMPIASDDPSVMNVAAIMGGGEIVDLNGSK